jgi:hypothetical protein
MFTIVLRQRDAIGWRSSIAMVQRRDCRVVVKCIAHDQRILPNFAIRAFLCHRNA